jgi:nucleoside-diphosphate-sugar epimerase
MERVLVSGSAGFIGGYVVEELLKRGYAVVGLDDFSKYGKITKSYDDHPHYRLAGESKSSAADSSSPIRRFRSRPGLAAWPQPA